IAVRQKAMASSLRPESIRNAAHRAGWDFEETYSAAAAVSLSSSAAGAPKLFGGKPLPRTVRVRPPVGVSMRSPSICTSCPNCSLSRREISPRETPVSGTSSLMLLDHAPVRSRAAVELILQAAELVEESARDDFAAQASSSKRGRRV